MFHVRCHDNNNTNDEKPFNERFISLIVMFWLLRDMPNVLKLLVFMIGEIKGETKFSIWWKIFLFEMLLRCIHIEVYL